ncbi:MAG: HlyD family efflux transporter periplasmic adaptor subunit [Pirellulales bacterium]
MSSAEQSSANKETIEQTKQQIRGLVGEIVQLSKSDLGPEQYYPAVLQRIVQALAAVGGAVWTMGEGRQLKLVYQQQLSDTLLDSQSEDGSRHQRLLDYVSASGQPQLVPPLSGLADERAGGNPTRYLLVLAPLIVDAACEGVIEIFQRPDSQPQAQRGYLKFVLQMCEQISEWLKSRKLKQFSDRHSLWAQADQYARLVHESLDLRETSYTIVNEGRRLIGCDRVSLALRHGGKCTVEAISGQDSLDNRSNVVVKLGTLATRVVAAGEMFHYSGSTAEMPPQLEEAVHDYVDESYSKTITVLPLRKPGETDTVGAKDALGDRRQDREILGALIIEQIDSELPREVMESRIDLVYEHTTRAIANSLEHNNLFLMPVWRAIGNATWIVKARTLPKTLTITALVLAVLIGLCVIPETFELQAKGELQPVVQRDVFVTEPGTVRQLKVKDGDQVEPGAVLLELSSDDLAREIQRVIGELETASEEEASVQRAKLQPNLKDADRVRLSGRAAELREKSKSLEKQLELLETKRDQLKVTSPIAGTVVLSWDIEKSLLHRPVERGQVLMSVADTTDAAEWELELFMPERRIGHIQRAQTLLKTQDLNVTYRLATEPGTTRRGKVKAIHPTTHIHEQEGQTVRIKVELDKSDLPKDLRPGASVIAQVEAGSASIAYSKLHEALEFVQTLWFKLF